MYDKDKKLPSTEIKPLNEYVYSSVNKKVYEKLIRLNMPLRAYEALKLVIYDNNSNNWIGLNSTKCTDK